MTFSASLNEPGSISWALPLASNASHSQLPSSVQLLSAADPSQFFQTGRTPTGTAQVQAALAAANATVTGLASETLFTLVLAARDAAPQANYVPAVVLLQLAAPDVRPPVFTSE